MRSEKRDGEELLVSSDPGTVTRREAKPKTPLFARLLTRVPAALSVTKTFVRVPSCLEKSYFGCCFQSRKDRERSLANSDLARERGRRRRRRRRTANPPRQGKTRSTSGDTRSGF